MIQQPFHRSLIHTLLAYWRSSEKPLTRSWVNRIRGHVRTGARIGFSNTCYNTGAGRCTSSGGKARCTGRSTTSRKPWRYGTTWVCRTGWRSPLLTGAASLARIFLPLGYRSPPYRPPSLPDISKPMLLLLPFQQLHRPPGEEVERVAVGLPISRLGCGVFVS